MNQLTFILFTSYLFDLRFPLVSVAFKDVFSWPGESRANSKYACLQQDPF
jgi:hypothetical protein